MSTIRVSLQRPFLGPDSVLYKPVRKGGIVKVPAEFEDRLPSSAKVIQGTEMSPEFADAPDAQASFMEQLAEIMGDPTKREQLQVMIDGFAARAEDDDDDEDDDDGPAVSQDTLDAEAQVASSAGGSAEAQHEADAQAQPDEPTEEEKIEARRAALAKKREEDAAAADAARAAQAASGSGSKARNAKGK